jgi:hypothetical protein
MNPPETDLPVQARTHLQKVLNKPIVRRRRNKPLHPDTVHDLLSAKLGARPRATTALGWLLEFRTKDGRWVHLNVDTIRDREPDGPLRPATYWDVVRIRDEEMSSQEHESCWMIMKTAENRTGRR